MAQLRVRHNGPELMDDPDVSETMLEAALGELPKINVWLGGYRATLGALESYRRLRRPTALRILDVGAGIGDYAFAMVRWGLRHDIDIRVSALDISPRTVAFATRAAARQAPETRSRVGFMEGDALDLALPPDSFDICTSALFLHHMDDEQCVRAIRQMSRVASEGIVVNDVHRHHLALHGIRAITRALPFSAMVRHDAPVSVCRGFTRPELTDLATTSGLADWRLTWRWAFRWILTSLPQA